MAEIVDKKTDVLFKQALDTLEQALPYAKELYQSQVFQEAARILDREEGMKVLYEYADRFEQSGIFEGGPWNIPTKLQPAFVGGSLMAEDITSVVEVMSELRMVSIAKGKHKSEQVTAEKAKDFLHEVMALNLDIIFPEETEAARIEGKGKQKDRADRLFQFLANQLSLAAVSGTLIDEIDRLTAQRPIMVHRIVSMITKSKQLLKAKIEQQEKKAISRYVDAVFGPTKRSKSQPEFGDYRKELKTLSDEVLAKEAKTFAKMMRETGLVSPYHAVLVRYCNRYKQEILPLAMELNEKGSASLNEHFTIVNQLIKVAIHPSTCQSLYGLTCLLERGVLSSNPVIPGLRRLIELDIQSEVSKVLIRSVKKSDGITANDIMVAGVISVLGQPLGIGQGMNPTCQTARGMSLWSLHAPGYLLELIPRAARDGDIDIMFEGQAIHSKDLQVGLVEDLHEELDPVSLILVPHLDRIYGELCRRAQFRGEDVHKWVNPAFYGDWVSKGFSSAVDAISGSIVDFHGFVRLFYATHHPEYNDEHELIYPNPVGIFITNVFGNFLGLHAVTIQRILKDPVGEYRIYFYNPNNDSSQNWGQGIQPKVYGNGEKQGESSLLFHEFVSRLYAFHYNPYEQGETYAVESEIVQKVESLAKESWGMEYIWANQ